MYDQSNLAKLILRLGFGGFMLTHGIPKLMKLLGEGGIRMCTLDRCRIQNQMGGCSVGHYHVGGCFHCSRC